MRRLWRSASVRRLAAIFLAAAAIAAICVAAYTAYSTTALKRAWLAHETALLGTMAQLHPELAEEWAKRSTSSALTPEAEEQGRKLAAAYGIDTRLDTALIPIVSEQRTRTWVLLGAGASALLGALFLLLLRESRSQLNDVRRLALSLEEAVKLGRPMHFRIYGEGEFGLLAHGVQELSLRLQETIAQLNRDKDFLKETIADISHQLKTPLASLTIYVELLQEGRVSPEEAAEFLRTCSRELERMEWLILTLLKIARLEADTLPMQMVQAPLAKTVEMAQDSARRLADEKAVSIVTEEPDEPVTLPHDPRWLAEAIGNLLKNAIEHSPAQGRVTVSWARTPVFVRLQVSDEGRGIDERHLPHIFKKFYRASSGGSGVGLGLPLAKTIAERHRGMLSVARNEAGGATFTMTLPFGQLAK
ncbi:sensor histidine kinase [Cohnella nanjingensis]|nr:HAMP domain-containing sensor histidine kinase [Cohnella nanjingensis]